jgi:(p)ppGpp synthase/HD superfamily hydrolase
MTRGYSDRINHAFAFAAKHHDQQVRKGTRLPYLTHPANVAVILTRYDRDEDTVLAGILHDVIEDCVRSSYTRQTLEQRIRDKFGDPVVETVLQVSKRDVDDSGTPLSPDEQREDYIQRLSSASESARWVCAADKIHNAGSILADLRRTADAEDREAIWRRFRLGKAGTARYYRAVYDRLREIAFDAVIMDELDRFVLDLEEWATEGPGVYASGGTIPAAESKASARSSSP